MAEPYTPQPVPNTGAPDIERYLAEELNRLAPPLRTAVQVAYGGMAITSSKTGTAGTTPLQILNYDLARPESGVDAVGRWLNAGELVPKEGGVYAVSAVVTVAIDSGRQYGLGLYLNDVATSVATVVEASNQSNYATLVLNVLTDVVASQRLSLWYNSTQNGSQFDILRCEFSINRVSEAR